MTKSDLVERVAAQQNISKAAASQLVDGLFNPTTGIIAKALKKGEEVNITGFGKFEARKRAARTGRNPRTGQEIKVPATRTPAFKAGKSLKDNIA